MSYLKKISALFVSSALMAALLTGCGGSSSGSTGDTGSQAEGGDGNYNISIVFKTTSNEYTQYMMAGAEKAAAETGAVLDMKGATSETAYDEQQNMIETDLHAGKYDAMIIAPLQGDMATTLVNGAEILRAFRATLPPMHAAPASRKALTAQAALFSQTRCSIPTQ